MTSYIWQKCQCIGKILCISLTALFKQKFSLMWMWCNRDLHYTWQALYYLLLNGDEFSENWCRWNTRNTLWVICLLFTGTLNWLSTHNNCEISSLISMIFTTLQSNALSLEQWLTQKPSTPLDSTLGKKPHIIVKPGYYFLDGKTSQTVVCQSNGLWTAPTSVCRSKSISPKRYMSDQWVVGCNNICLHK